MLQIFDFKNTFNNGIYMKRILCFLLFLLLSVLCMSTPISYASTNANWDGMIHTKIVAIDVACGNNYDFRVSVASPDLLNDCNTPHEPITWCYVNESDPNYKTYVSLLTLAYTMDYSVVLYLNKVQSSPGSSIFYAHIGYISVRK